MTLKMTEHERFLDAGDDNLCEQCEEEQGRPPHPCPYKEDVNNNNDECNCCDKCERECAMDI